MLRVRLELELAGDEDYEITKKTEFVRTVSFERGITPDNLIDLFEELDVTVSALLDLDTPINTVGLLPAVDSDDDN